MKKAQLTPLALALFCGAAHSATINWGAPTDAVDENVIISPSNVVQAWNASGNTNTLDVTVGGTTVTFTGTGAGGVGAGFTSGANPDPAQWLGTPADADFSTILDETRWGPSTVNIQLTGLTPSQEYDVQIFYSDARGCCNGRLQNYTAGNTSANVAAGGTGGNGLGQFVVGSFTADAATQDISVFNADGAHFNALVVAAVPEPSGAILLGLGAVGLLVRRRR